LEVWDAGTVPSLGYVYHIAMTTKNRGKPNYNRWKNIGNRKLMKETKSQNQQACQKKKYTS
jgi:hypothetical protein